MPPCRDSGRSNGTAFVYTHNASGLEATLHAAGSHDARRGLALTLALRNTLGVGREELRETLPFLAYKCRDGPWKGLWSRFGFDPRVDPSARALQVCPI